MRLFNTTEVFRLDPGTYRLELAYASGAPHSQPTMDLRAEVGLTHHFQVSVGQTASVAPGQNLQLSATPISVRYTLGREPGDIYGNPAVEAVVIPRVDARSRAALRVLAAEEIVPRLVVAMNGYLEQNLDRSAPVGVDGSVGVTGGVSYSLLPNLLKVGGEAQIGAAQYGQPRYSFVGALGPNVVLHRGFFGATVSGLFDLAQPRVGFEPTVTMAATF